MTIQNIKNNRLQPLIKTVINAFETTKPKSGFISNEITLLENKHLSTFSMLGNNGELQYKTITIDGIKLQIDDAGNIVNTPLFLSKWILVKTRKFLEKIQPENRAKAEHINQIAGGNHTQDNYWYVESSLEEKFNKYSIIERTFNSNSRYISEV